MAKEEEEKEECDTLGRAGGWGRKAWQEAVGVLLRDSLLYVSNYKREIGEYRE